MVVVLVVESSSRERPTVQKKRHLLLDYNDYKSAILDLTAEPSACQQKTQGHSDRGPAAKRKSAN